MKTMYRIMMYTGMALNVLATGLTACGPPPLTPASALDTPQAAYERGQRALASGDLAQAQIEFDRAQRLDPDFAPAYEGLGLVQLARGDRQEAKQLFDRAKNKDEAYAPAWIGMGRVYDAEQRYGQALREFQEALRRDTRKRWAKFAHFHIGQTYEHQENFNRAQEAYRSALTLDPAYAPADQAWKRMNERQRTMAGMPAEYRAIAQSPAITRAELAALIANELSLNTLFQKPAGRREPDFQAPGATVPDIAAPESVPDATSSWARAYIDQTVAAGVMELHPDGMFKPEEKVTRVELAQVAQNVLIAALRDPSLATAYIGNASTLRDVPGTHFAFNAITLAVSRGIMAPKQDGAFGLTDTVSGTEALRVVRTLKNMGMEGR